MSFVRLGSLLGRTFRSGELERAVDRAHVAVGLGEVAEHAPSAGIEFLREQSDIVATGEQTLEESMGVAIAALQQIVVDQPEAAGQEGTFAWRQAVETAIGFVSEDKSAVDQKPFLDRRRGRSPQHQPLRTCDRIDDTVLGARDPGHRCAIVETDHQLGAKCHPTGAADDKRYEVGSVVDRGMKSIRVTDPLSVRKSVSRINVSGR